MTPRLISRYFGPGKDQMWSRMAAVLSHTARVHCPGWVHDVRMVAPAEPDLASPLGRQNTVWNTHKLDAWAQIVHEAEEGAQILLIDTDTAITRPLDDVWAREFDLAYTTKGSEARFPLNGGVLFLRVSEATRAFMAAWRAENRRMLDDASYFQVWSPAYGGVNQAALGAILRQKPALRLMKLPCLEWNCEDEHWHVYDQDITRIVHYKAALRTSVFQMTAPESDGERVLVKLWRQLEKASQRPFAAVVIEDRMVMPSEIETPMVSPWKQRKPKRHQTGAKHA